VSFCKAPHKHLDDFHMALERSDVQGALPGSVADRGICTRCLELLDSPWDQIGEEWFIDGMSMSLAKIRRSFCSHSIEDENWGTSSKLTSAS
jgi:hypothetical protein